MTEDDTFRNLKKSSYQEVNNAVIKEIQDSILNRRPSNTFKIIEEHFWTIDEYYLKEMSKQYSPITLYKKYDKN